MTSFNRLGMHLGNLSRLSNTKTRSISPENITGEKGKGGMAAKDEGAKAARDLGRGGLASCASIGTTRNSPRWNARWVTSSQAGGDNTRNCPRWQCA